jgi:hypothetical protein
MKRKFPYTKSLSEAYELRVVRTDGCWGWIGYTNFGYPMISSTKIHRWSLEQKLGRKLNSDEQCRHLCGNRLCTNPEHLDIGSQSDNELDKQRHFNGKFGSSSKYKLTAEDAEQIRKLRGTLFQREIAEMFNITQMMVSRIQTGKAWNVDH